MNNNRQPRLDMHKIREINKKYNFKIKQVREDLLLITTGLNEWMIELEEPSAYNKKYIVLKHKNLRFNRDRWHEQRRFYDYQWALGHIDYHDNRRMKVLNKSFNSKKHIDNNNHTI